MPTSRAFLPILALVLTVLTPAVGAAPSEFGARPLTPVAYKSYEIKSQYLTMRDGTKIAVDVLFPDGLEDGEKIPALVYQTSFWRSVEVRWPFNHFHGPDPLQVFFVNHGYAVVLVDVRGTGASFGSRLYPWHQEELKDGKEVVDWVVAQSWSDGTVGSFGAGYEGSAAELLATVDHPAVKAIMPMYSEFDTYTETAFPGGIFNEWFVRKWSQFNVEMCNNELPKEVGRVARSFARGVSPVASDSDGSLLARALKEHAANLNLFELAKAVESRDTTVEAGKESGSIQNFTVYSYRDKVEASGVAVFAWGSWLDGASADSVIRRFLTYSNPIVGAIGPWNKGGTQNASPYAASASPTPSLDAQYEESLRFFNDYVRGAASSSAKEHILYYYTMGEEKWKSTAVWPPQGFSDRRYYLGAGKVLYGQPPANMSGSESYAVDPTATTGDSNRWHSHLLGAPVSYPDRRTEDAKLLTYTSQPLEASVEITGHPIVSLNVTSTATDGAFYVYLEEVDPDGRVTYLTEGELRGIHRKVSAEEPPYALLTPYHTFLEKDVIPLTPGERTEITFGLLPLSVRIPRGHSIRVAVAGHDASTFVRIPDGELPTITVGHDSWIDLPMRAGE